MLLTLLFLSNPKTIIFIIFVLVLFFGAKRIPELFRGVGQGVREFKDASTEQPRPPFQAPGQPQQPGQAYGQPNSGYQGQPGQLPTPPAAPYNPNHPAA
ncbi:twin-arginine translocase TatA/TatE family subunit [Hymenobacter sp.]|uniref:twin-arginine translocase TatA/TatE family subunit n=1 Tax=Hymenobacter sp. TaxID=1898978 RepID=UPI0039C86B0B